VPDEIAAWLYNTSDHEGLYLASVIATQLVRVASTGLRVFGLPWRRSIRRYCPGDVIVIAINGYTDYDPATQTVIKGPISIRGVLVGVGNEGRQLSMFVPGLRDNVQLVKGGAAGTLTGLGTQPAPPTLSVSFDNSGQLIIDSLGDFSTASHRIAWASGAPPSAATVRAQTPIAGQNVNGLATGSIYPPGTTVYIAAFAYGATGLESSPLSTRTVISWRTGFYVKASDAGGGAVDPVVVEAGGKPVNRLYAKPLAGDPDTSDSLLNGLTFRTIHGGYTDASNRPVRVRRTVGTDDLSADVLGGGLGAGAENMVVNGGGQDGALGSAAPNWTLVAGVALQSTATAAFIGDRSLLLTHFSAADSASGQNFSVVDQGVYELSGWIKVDSLAGAGAGAFLNVDAISGVTSFVILEKIGTAGPGVPAEPDVGVPTSVATQDFTFVKCTFRVNGTGVIRIAPHLGYNGTLTGSAWFDGLTLKRVIRSAFEGGSRGFAGFQDLTGLLATGAKESGSKPVNRLLAKTLAADPDSLDGTPDGTTFKRVTGVNGSSQITPTSSVGRNRVKATRTAAQSIPDSTLTAMLWTGTDAYDSNSLHDPAGATPSRIVVPTGGGIGIWILTAQISWANNATGLRSLYIYKNGVTRLKRSNAAGINIGAVGNYMEITAVDDAPAVGDYYELYVEQNSGVALNASPAGEDWLAATHMW
jgi:hypothetical protein